MRSRLLGLAVSVAFALSPSASAAASPTVSYPNVPIVRYAGADRFETAADISANTFAPGVRIVYIAYAFNFPDALAGAAAAAGSDAKGPVLLADTHLPLNAATARELDRLHPDEILILGSSAVVGEDVADALRAWTGWVSRDAGDDRFGTAAAIAFERFKAAPVPVAYIAYGLDFPDALAGAAAAGTGHGPLLLTVTGRFASGATTFALDYLQPQRIVVLGSAALIGDNILNEFRQYTTGPVDRYGGRDRYETAAAVSQHTFAPGVPVAYLAYSMNFPDALAAAAASGTVRGPVLLTPTNGPLPAATKAELTRLKPQKVVLLGSTAVVSDGLRSEINQALGFTQAGDGTYRVGTNIPAGTYRATGGATCYWERLSGFGGTLDEVIANSFGPKNPVVTISPSDAGFRTWECGTWTNNLVPITTSRTAPFGDGQYIVGYDIDAGTWQAPGGAHCYWARESGFGGTLDEIIDNDFGATNPIVTIDPSDSGFVTDGCGAWTPLG